MNFIQMKEGLSITADHAKSRYRVKYRRRNGYFVIISHKIWNIGHKITQKDMKNIGGV